MALQLTYKGFDYVSYYNGGYANADSLAALVTTGANTVALNREFGIDVVHSTIYADANYTDSAAVLGATIDEAKALGLSVMVRPMVDFLAPAKIGSYAVGDWRTYYNPANASAFFASYKAMIVGEAQIAEAHGAPLLCLGLEIDQLCGPAFLAQWTDIIGAVRAVYHGKLTYSADWNAAASPWQGVHGLGAGTGDLTTQISFWKQLDFIGIDQYAPLSDVANPTLAQLIAGWTQVPTDPATHAVTGQQSLISYYEGVAAKLGMPLLFTELGYESASDAAQSPAGSATNVFDAALQARLYQAFFTAWQQSGNAALAGALFWNWDPNAAEVGPGNGANFSPQGLAAQGVAASGFAGTTPPPTGPDTVNGGAGDDSFAARNSDTVFIGGGGFDSYLAGVPLFAPGHAGLTIGHAQLLATVTLPGGAINTLQGVAHLVFSDGALTLDGNPLIDPLYYATANPDAFAAGVDAVAHYNSYGWHERRNPDAVFSTATYLAVNHDVAAAGINPLAHFDSYGWREGRDPSAGFDVRLYLLRNPDVAAAGIDPLMHYLAYGQAEGRLALPALGLHITAGFDPTYYALANPDVAAAGINPAAHWAAYGWHEVRNPDAFFDTGWYLAHNPDVAAAGIDPLAHYDSYGWKEGRDPSSHFSTAAYLAHYADVAAARIDPLQHFLQYGLAEGRSGFGDIV